MINPNSAKLTIGILIFLITVVLIFGIWSFCKAASWGDEKDEVIYEHSKSK